MTRRRGFLVLATMAALAVAGSMAARPRADAPRHAAPPSASGDIVVALCDGETTAEITGVKEGETPTREQAQDVADRLMAEWRRRHPDAEWRDPVRLAQAPAGRPEQAVPPPAAGTSVERGTAEREGAARGAQEAAQPQGALQSGHTYGAFSDRDERIWAAETQKFVQEGHRVFHDAAAVGSTIAVSCDMCHPDGVNTHPETYPKFQVQLGRVALLRDMINWCIQNPSRGKPLREDDPKLKAIEAYVLAQRKGVALEFGKH
jgi:hypothetical protein